MSFAQLGLSEPIVRAVTERGYHEPTPIQAQAIPAVLSGRDLLAGAQTGTGKTAGFTLPLLHRLSEVDGDRGGRRPVRCLILTPTRELAAQVEESVRAYGRYLALESTVVFGGVGMQPQVDRLRKGVDILVATPGRLLDHAQQRTVDLSKVEILVLDEADRMLDMGFIHDIRRVLALLPKKRQNLLFSATFPDEIRQLADKLLDHPATVEVAPRNTTTALVQQRVILAEKGVKRAMLSHLIGSRGWRQVLVFTRTKHGANRLAEQLSRDGITAMAIHGNKSQSARTRALSEFKEGRLQVLVATEIAARGLDIVELPYVVNYELPNVPEDYVHRIGRTGRAGAQGVAYSLVGSDEKGLLADIEKLTRQQIERETLPDFDMRAALAEASARVPAPAPGAREGGRGERRREPRAPNVAGGTPQARREGQSRGRSGRSAPRGTGDAAPGSAPAQPPRDGRQAPRTKPVTADSPAGQATRVSRPKGQAAEPPRTGRPRAAGGGRRSAEGARHTTANVQRTPRQGAEPQGSRREDRQTEEGRNGRLKGALAQALSILKRLG